MTLAGDWLVALWSYRRPSCRVSYSWRWTCMLAGVSAQDLGKGRSAELLRRIADG
jgi:hypothetical protein